MAGATRSREWARHDAEEFDESLRSRTGRIPNHVSNRAFRSSGRVRRRIGKAVRGIRQVLVQAGPGCRSARGLRYGFQRLPEGLFVVPERPDLQGVLLPGTDTCDSSAYEESAQAVRERR